MISSSFNVYLFIVIIISKLSYCASVTEACKTFSSSIIMGTYVVLILVCVVYHIYLKRIQTKEIDENCGI